jgi:hypothetical protein
MAGPLLVASDNGSMQMTQSSVEDRLVDEVITARISRSFGLRECVLITGVADGAALAEGGGAGGNGGAATATDCDTGAEGATEDFLGLFLILRRYPVRRLV